MTTPPRPGRTLLKDAADPLCELGFLAVNDIARWFAAVNPPDTRVPWPGGPEYVPGSFADPYR